MKRTKSAVMLHFGDYLKKNWANLVVLGFVLSLSASASLIIYEYATQSIADVSQLMLQKSVSDISTRIASYLAASTSIIPAARAFLEARQIDTGAVAQPDVYTASRIWGYFFNTTANTANSLYYYDKYGNNLGWGNGATGPAILLQWPSIVPGVNLYVPEHGQIGNLSAPVFHQDGTVDLPVLSIVQNSGKPYWAPVAIVRIDSDDVQAVLGYAEPAYFSNTGDFCCIVGSTIYINAFEAVLASYDVGKGSTIFITDRTGTLIADSVGGVQQYLKPSENSAAYLNPTLPNVTDHTDPIIAKAANYIVNKYGGFSELPDAAQSLQFKFKGATQILLVGNYQKDNLRLNIVIIVPYSSFFAKILLSKRITIAFTVVAVVCGFVRYLLSWRLMIMKKNHVGPDVELSTSSIGTGYASRISVSMSTHSTHSDNSQTSLFHESPAVLRKDVFGDNSPAVVDMS